MIFTILITMHCFVLFLAFLLTNVHAQSSECRCTCCRSSAPGQQCVPISLPSINMYTQTCSLEICISQCRSTYFECQGTTAADQITPVCATSTNTTTTTTTTMPNWLSHTCRCISNELDACGSPKFLGMTSASSCSCDACTQACRNRYVSSLNNQIAGTCVSGSTAARFCNCQCSDTKRTIDYKVSTNETCSECNKLCRENQPCESAAQVLQLSCSDASKQILFSSFHMILIISLSIFF